MGSILRRDFVRLDNLLRPIQRLLRELLYAGLSCGVVRYRRLALVFRLCLNVGSAQISCIAMRLGESHPLELIHQPCRVFENGAIFRVEFLGQDLVDNPVLACSS